MRDNRSSPADEYPPSAGPARRDAGDWQRLAAWTWAGIVVAVGGVAAAAVWAVLLHHRLDVTLIGPALVGAASVVLGLVVALTRFAHRPGCELGEPGDSAAGTKRVPEMTPTTTPHCDRGPKDMRPSAMGYRAGGTLLAVTTIGAIVWVALGWLGLMHHVDGFQRTAVPGTATVHIDTPSTRVLYFESARGTPAFTAGDVTITGPGRTGVPVQGYVRDLRYDVPGDFSRVGRAVTSFRATAAGDYAVTVKGPSAGTLAIGDDIVWDAVPHVIGAGALFLAGAGAGLTLIITTAIRRSRAGSPRSLSS